tara:strand:- start:616 stop:768 length:153 start_codon:yes stop_codon:yes gene_type:complete
MSVSDGEGGVLECLDCGSTNLEDLEPHAGGLVCLDCIARVDLEETKRKSE